LQSLHRASIILIVGASAVIIFAMRVLFQNEQSAVVGFLTLILTGIIVVIFSFWSLRPWVLPRFLLPIDLDELDIEKLMELFKDPQEYLILLKNHIEILTESFLLPKLRRLRNALISLAFGISVAILLAIMLP